MARCSSKIESINIPDDLDTYLGLEIKENTTYEEKIELYRNPKSIYELQQGSSLPLQCLKGLARVGGVCSEGGRGMNPAGEKRSTSRGSGASFLDAVMSSYYGRFNRW